MPLHLLRDRIQVLPDRVRDDVSSAGIVIAASKGIVDSQKQFGRKGTVVAIGADIDGDQLPVGTQILWGEFLFPEFHEDGVTYLVLQDKDVTAVTRPNATALAPLHDRLFVKRTERVTATASGILLPDVSGEKQEQGIVLAAGPGNPDGSGYAPMLVKTGDTVLFGKHSGQTVKVAGDELLVMRQDDVFAIVEAA